MALNCTLHPVSTFDRKHYFYADLPTGYQITQRFQPIATNGWMEYAMYVVDRDKEPRMRKVGIEQLQLEQDSGKSFHNAKDGYSLIDLNRAGIGLMEIITRPEFENGEQAAFFVRELTLILRELGVCDVKMFEGSLRVDANISVRRPGDPLGVRSEVKNLASAKFVNRAVDYEIARQIKLKESGGEVVNETRGFDLSTSTTFPMRDKEILQDYRYMPEPNLPPLRLFDSYSGQTVPEHQVDIATLRTRLPEPPAAKRQRYIQELKLTPAQAVTLISAEGLPKLFEGILQNAKSPKTTPTNVAKHLLTVALATLNDLHDTLVNRQVDAQQVAVLIDMLHEERLPRVIFVKLLDQLVKQPDEIRDVEEHVIRNNFLQVNDEARLGAWCDQVILSHPDKVELVRKGKDRVLNFLTNEVKILSEDRANLRQTKVLLDKKVRGDGPVILNEDKVK
ncbi:glutamyl-tRNA(Gln) amidotransferase subunit B, mitochondrial-like isoform X2 [Paramacrobiotus metropolitanus]|nr:glutamyl-tRNA(Gln) amidotransferase subunit B, mitochondrial-like isoform X2 [Paramacrobiotus metropolitanus]